MKFKVKIYYTLKGDKKFNTEEDIHEGISKGEIKEKILKEEEKRWKGKWAMFRNGKIKVSDLQAYHIDVEEMIESEEPFNVLTVMQDILGVKIKWKKKKNL